MEDDMTFLEQPLERNLYKPKYFYPPPKPPLRILVTDAGCKIAYNLIYKICSGEVFGSDQEIILHLVFNKGTVNPKAIIYELEECGFAPYKGFVVSGNPQIAYGQVDIVIAITTFEKKDGRTNSGTLMYQLAKACQVGKLAKAYASKDVKVIFIGPSTKAITLMLAHFHNCTEILPRNVSSVTYLDVVISKALLAAKLKTTTDKIKNVVIWSVTYPDLSYATVRTYPPNDIGGWELQDVPITDLIDDEKWLSYVFPMSIYRRRMDADLLSNGKAVAQSTVRHLQFLFKDTTEEDEIMSMGVLCPKNNPWGIPCVGASLPVIIENGCWKLREELKFCVYAHLNMLKGHCYDKETYSVHSLMNKVLLILKSQERKNYGKSTTTRESSLELFDENVWYTYNYIVPLKAENIQRFGNQSTTNTKKVIAWNEATITLNESRISSSRSFIKFIV